MLPPATTLTLDLTESILLLLPAKSLVRFQLISSSFSSMISNPLFRKAHSNRAYQNPNLSPPKALLLTSTLAPASIRFTLLDPQKSFSNDGDAQLNLRSPLERVDRRIKVVGSCNGLVCLDLGYCREFLLWNPSTGESKKLPDSCVPLGKPFTPGFGYDSASDDFKIVLVSFHPITKSYSHENKFRKTQYHMVTIFSLKRNSWRNFEQFDAPGCYFVQYSGAYHESIFVNGAIHWRSSTFESVETITAFDLEKEKFYLDPYPKPPRRFKTYNTRVLGGCLYLVCFMDCERNSVFELWVMKEYGVEASWTKLIPLLNPNDRVCGNVSSANFYEPLCVSDDNTFVLVRNREELIRFNERGEIVEKVWIGDDDTDGCQGISYVESIVSVDVSSNE